MTELCLTTKQRNKIKRALKSLEEVRKEINQDTEDKAMWYLEDCGNLYLMDGQSHSEGYDAHARSNAVIECFDFLEASGGGW